MLINIFPQLLRRHFCNMLIGILGRFILFAQEACANFPGFPGSSYATAGIGPIIPENIADTLHSEVQETLGFLESVFGGSEPVCEAGSIPPARDRIGSPELQHCCEFCVREYPGTHLGPELIPGSNLAPDRYEPGGGYQLGNPRPG